MAALGRIAAIGLVTATLSGCLFQQLPPPETVTLAPGVTLPFKARVMIFAGDDDLNRNLITQITRYQTEESQVKDGLAMAKATRTLLSKGFQQVEINTPGIQPQIVVKLYGKTSWAKLDGIIKVGCAIDVWTADGIPLGNFGARFTAENTDYRTEVESAYGQCLKKPVEEFLHSATLARLAASGFKDPPAPAVAEWMRTLGPITPLR